MAGQLFIINMKQILYKINFTAENDYSYSNWQWNYWHNTKTWFIKIRIIRLS
jgi:hypothetical protein